MARPWRLESAAPELAERLARESDLPLPLARALAVRGFVVGSEVDRFLEPRLEHLIAPVEMAGLPLAVQRLQQAVEQGELIGVFGDYDVDGVTSAAIVGDYLERCGGRMHLRAARRDEGYGFGTTHARELVTAGCRVLVLTDCGTADRDAVGLAAQAGVDVIAVDHHRVADGGPWPGHALINPHQPGCGFPYKGLCSAGLAFYLMAALRRALASSGRPVPDPRDALDLVALGTVADVAPLDGVNRILVAKGLQQVGRSSRPGLRELTRLADLEGKIPSSEEIAWRLAPRLNAPGRLGDAAVALECLYLRDDAQAVERARRCHGINEERKEIQAKILADATRQAEQRADDSFCLVSAQGWHPGVIGIVAGRLAEALGRPVAVVAQEGPQGRASARSIPGLDLFELLRQCSEHLVRFGGHAAAAGFTVEVGKIEALRRALCRATTRALDGFEPAPLRIAALLELEQVDRALCQGMRRLEPFGEGNRPPVFGATRVQVELAREVGEGHLAVTLRQGRAVRQAIGFGLAHKMPEVGDEIDIAFVPEIDHYRGVERLRLRLVDVEVGGGGIEEAGAR